MAYDYNALVESQLRGELPQDVINQIAQRAAERGVATGMPSAPGANAAYLAAIGSNSLEQVRHGQGAYERQQQIALEERRLAEQARQFAANLSFQEKSLAQQLGISEMEFALEKAKMANQESQFSRTLGEGNRRFDLGYSLDQRELSEGARQFDINAGLNAAKFGEGMRQFDLGFDLNRDQFEEGNRRFDDQMDLNVSNMDPDAAFRWSWMTGNPQAPSGRARPYEIPQTTTYYRRPGQTSWYT